MDIHEKNRIIYEKAKEYLKNNANPQKYQHYFRVPKVHSLKEAFEVAVSSVRDITVTGKVIKYDKEENYAIIEKCLFAFDYERVLGEYGDIKENGECYTKLLKKMQPEGATSWERFSKNICCIASYINNYSSIEQMLCYFNRPQNVDERIELAKGIIHDIYLWDFKMVCNWLKDIGVNGFAKPDSVLTYIFTELGLADNNNESVFKAVNLMAQDNNTSVFLVDRTFWLIGTSDSTTIHAIERKEGKNKKDFVETVKESLKTKICVPYLR